MFEPCFVIQRFVSFLVFQSFRWGQESWLLDFYCLLDVTCCCKCSLPLPHGAVDWSVVCAYDISYHTDLLFAFAVYAAFKNSDPIIPTDLNLK